MEGPSLLAFVVLGVTPIESEGLLGGGGGTLLGGVGTGLLTGVFWVTP